VVRTTRAKDQGQGTPQGGVLVARCWRTCICDDSSWPGNNTVRATSDAHIVNYADDFVICTRDQADEAMEQMRQIMGKLKYDGE